MRFEKSVAIMKESPVPFTRWGSWTRQLAVSLVLFWAAGTLSLSSASAAPDTDNWWMGAGLLKGGKGYAPNPMGQVHYRDIGPKDGKKPVILLLHVVPM